MRKKSIWSGILALWLLALASCTGTDPGTTVKKPSAPLTSEGDSSFSEGKNSSGEVSLSPLPPSVDVTDFPSLTGSLPASEDTGSPTAAPTPTPTPTSDPTPKVPPFRRGIACAGFFPQTLRRELSSRPYRGGSGYPCGGIGGNSAAQGLFFVGE